MLHYTVANFSPFLLMFIIFQWFSLYLNSFYIVCIWAYVKGFHEHCMLVVNVEPSTRHGLTMISLCRSRFWQTLSAGGSNLCKLWKLLLTDRKIEPLKLTVSTVFSLTYLTQWWTPVVHLNVKCIMSVVKSNSLCFISPPCEF